MTNMKFNKKLCAVCIKEILPLGFEEKIAKNHADKMDSFGLREMGTEIYINDFQADPHLKCRIKCARYYVCGLGSKWFATNQFIVTSDNRTAFESIEKSKRMNYRQLQSNGIYFYGTPGIGKTQLLADLFKNICDRSANPANIYWANSATILRSLRDSFGKKYGFDEETVPERIKRKLNAGYLFLDDLGSESATEWAKESLYDAINYRYEEQLPLFVSSNFPPKALAEKLNDKLVSRLFEMCRVISVKGEDMRLKKASVNEDNIGLVIPEFSYQMANWNTRDIA